MPEVESGVFAAVKREYPPFRFGVRFPSRRLPAVAVPEGGGAPFGVGPFQLVHVLLGNPQFGSGLPGGESPGDRLLDHRFDVGVVESIHGSVLQPNDGTGDNQVETNHWIIESPMGDGALETNHWIIAQKQIAG